MSANKGARLAEARVVFAMMTDGELVEIGKGRKHLDHDDEASRRWAQMALDEQRFRGTIKSMERESVEREFNFLNLNGVTDGGRLRALKVRASHLNVARKARKRKKFEERKNRQEVTRRIEQVVERRVLERSRLESTMRSAPSASAAHRGTKSHHALKDQARREVDKPQERTTDGRFHPVRLS